jgi:hypothetical protein
LNLSIGALIVRKCENVGYLSYKKIGAHLIYGTESAERFEEKFWILEEDLAFNGLV